jgi:uncharacterized protein
MKSQIISLGRVEDAALAIAAALNWLLVAGVFAALLAVSTEVHAAETPVCTGSDLVAGMRAEAPERFAAIQEQAARTENGEALLWRIETPGSDVAPSYLFGTMHVTDPRVVDLSDPVRAAFEAAETIVIESTDILDRQAMMAALAAEPQLTMFTDGTTLRSLIAEEDLPMVEEALRQRGMPLATISRMKPWMISSMVALPACEFDRQAKGRMILDVMLAQEAQAAGKALAGLESAAEQLGAMASLPMELHIEALVETLRLGPMVEDVLETMVTLYLAEEIGMFWPFFRAVLPSGEDGEAGYVLFEEAMVNARNRVMAERALPIIEEGAAFIAVGALHLPGPEGVVALLREKGYRVIAEPSRPD